MADETEETTDVTEPEAAAEVVTEPETVIEADVVAEAAPAEAAPAPVAKATPAPLPVDDGTRHNGRKVREGVVVSDAMQSTVVVAVVERVRHPRYGKTVQRTKKLYVHDAEDTAKVGDRVRVQETRPLSKLKRWRLTEVVERAR
jgi:small subunit ribosomal protein S17